MLRFCRQLQEARQEIDIEVVPQGESNASSQVMNDLDAAADVFGFASDQGLALFKDEYLLKVRLNFVQPIKDTNITEAVDTATFQTANDDQPYLYATGNGRQRLRAVL